MKASPMDATRHIAVRACDILVKHQAVTKEAAISSLSPGCASPTESTTVHIKNIKAGIAVVVESVCLLASTASALEATRL